MIFFEMITFAASPLLSFKISYASNIKSEKISIIKFSVPSPSEKRDVVAILLISNSKNIFFDIIIALSILLDLKKTRAAQKIINVAAI